MYVKKFEGETLDEALQLVKRELGPDAIILKTITNKGLKGAFKKSKIEITAAISEQNYERKAKVDHVLTDDQKSDFYRAPSRDINHSINDYNNHQTPSNRTAGAGGYGGLGLNKVVNSVSKAGSKFKNSLDDFLATPEEEPRSFAPERMEVPTKRPMPAPRATNVSAQNSYSNDEVTSNIINEAYSDVQHSEAPRNHGVANHAASTEIALELKQQIKHQQNQIELLEKKLTELTQNLSISNTHHDDNEGIKELRRTLKTLDLNDKIVSGIVKKAMFELTKEELDEEDIVYDFALNELNNSIKTAMPLFSEAKVQDKPVVTALISEQASGQSSMGLKLAVLKENSKVIQFRTHGIDKANNEFAAQVFKLDIAVVDSLSHLMSECRKAIAENKNIILDIKTNSKDLDESKKIIETLKRSFDNLEILVTVSAINSELYNRKILSKYKEYANGVIISYVDQCLNFGALVNIHFASSQLPFKFFGTGQAVPDDIEAATSERILAGMFEF
jgi:flagellar biosynthesis protein FlhF